MTELLLAISLLPVVAANPETLHPSVESRPISVEIPVHRAAVASVVRWLINAPADYNVDISFQAKPLERVVVRIIGTPEQQRAVSAVIRTAEKGGTRPLLIPEGQLGLRKALERIPPK